MTDPKPQPENETVAKLVEMAREAAAYYKAAKAQEAQDQINRLLEKWELPWRATTGQFDIPDTEVALTANAEYGNSLTCSFVCPKCQRIVRRSVQGPEGIGAAIAMSRGEFPMQRHDCNAEREAAARENLQNPFQAFELIMCCEDLLEEIERQTPKANTNPAADYLLQLKVKAYEIEAMIRAAYAKRD